ncbi:MAG: sensor histidine kinase [Spirosomataceae bacterium]
MKRLLLLLTLASIHLSGSAQKDVFRIDSIPATGILLDKGWKWHAGDNSDFAKSDFDDSQWEDIDPTKDIMALDQIRKPSVVWFRLPLVLHDSTFYQMLSLVVKQTGATEFYLNGRLLGKFGNISLNKSNTIGYDPMGQAIALPLELNKSNVLAVRFAFPDIFLVKNFYAPNYCLKLIVCPIKDSPRIGERINRLSNQAHYSEMFKAGIFFLFAILHLGFFMFFPKQQANLYFGIYAFLLFLVIFVESLTSTFVFEVNLRNQIALITCFIHPFPELFIFIAIYYFLNLTRGFYFKLTVIVCFLSIPFMFRPYFGGQMIGLLAPSTLISIGFPIICHKAQKKGIQGAYGIFIASIIFLILYTSYTLVREFQISLPYQFLWNELTFSTAVLAVPAAISYYLMVDFTNSKKQLKNNFYKFQQLSKEKEASLLKQNAELQAALLQGQTIERKRVAADLHDSLGSTMSSLIYTVNAIDTNHLDNQEKKVYQHLKQMLDTAYNEIRLLSHNLLPEEFEKQGLAEALRTFIRKINQTKTIHFDLTIDPQLGRLSPKTEFELYSICLELINNILKHSQATEAEIRLSKTTPPLGQSAIAAGGLELTISDNGIGFFSNESDGKGIKNVKARVESLNGIWNIKNEEGGGMSSEIVVPIN